MAQKNELNVSAFRHESGKVHVISSESEDDNYARCGALIPLDFKSGFRPRSLDQVTCRNCHSWLTKMKDTGKEIIFE